MFTASGEGHGQSITLEFAGTPRADGALAGKASTAMDEMTWKAVRARLDQPDGSGPPSFTSVCRSASECDMK